MGRLVDGARTIGGVPAPSSHPTRALLIVNPAAGGGRAGRLGKRLRAGIEHATTGVQVLESRAPGHARELASRAAADGHHRVIAVGGDGTVQEVINGLLQAGSGTSLGIVPGGNGNDLARSLGLPSRPEAALEVALGASTVTIDVGRASVPDGDGSTSRYFAAAGGVGFDAQVAASMANMRGAWQRGRLGYAMTVLAELRRFRNSEVVITAATADGERRMERRVLFMAIANGPYYGGGMRICPDALLDDGWLDLCIVGDISRIEAVRQIPGIYGGRHVRHPAVEFVRARSVRVEGAEGTPSHLDGEPFHPLPLWIDLLPQAISVAAMPAATGALQSRP
jgi:diacylglycerol kinase (ATP)